MKSSTTRQPDQLPPRLQHEFKTITAMVALYCKAHHSSTVRPCPNCAELQKYARLRLHRCPFQEAKPTCGKCTVHCYKPAMRSEIRKVMRYAGSRMTLYHPVLALRHLLDSCRTSPKLPKKKSEVVADSHRIKD